MWRFLTKGPLYCTRPPASADNLSLYLRCLSASSGPSCVVQRSSTSSLALPLSQCFVHSRSIRLSSLPSVSCWRQASKDGDNVTRNLAGGAGDGGKQATFIKHTLTHARHSA
jgi:hypothetical protein